MKNNTEESNAIAKYASNLTYQLFVALQLPGNQDRSSNIVAFVKYVSHIFCLYRFNSIPLRVLQDIAAFTKERAERSELKGSLSEQREAGDIKKWEERLGRAYERFNVSDIISCPKQRLKDMIDPHPVIYR
jgi:hypothetical protein